MDSQEYRDLSTPYDFDSIMVRFFLKVFLKIKKYLFYIAKHYDEYAFTNNNKPTITPISKENKIKGSEKLSRIDINEIRMLYKCSTKRIISINGFLSQLANSYYMTFKARGMTDCVIICLAHDRCGVCTYDPRFNICFIYNRNSSYRFFVYGKNKYSISSKVFY